MKLILASDLSFLLKYGYALTGIPKEEMNIGYVTTASNVARTKSFFVDIKNKIKDRCGVTDFTALNYVPFILKVHYTDEQENKVQEKSATAKHLLRILRDGQGILVEDDKYTFFGGDEVIIK